MRQTYASNKSKWLEGIILVGLFLAIILPRSFNLTTFTTIDEGLWLYRSANFYYALGQREFEYTHQSEHPGVTTMWAGAFGFLVEYPEYRGLGQEYYMNNGIEFHKFLQKTEKTEIDLIASGRRFMVLETTALLLLSFWMVRRIIGNFPAILGFFLLALTPFHIGLTKILHLDGLLTGFMFLSSISLTLYLWIEHKPIYLIISAAAGACSILTKIPGIFMIPFAGLLLFIKYLEEKPYCLKNLLTQIVFPLILWILVAILVFFLLWPAMWVNPINTLQDIYTRSTGHIEGEIVYLHNEEDQSLTPLDISWYPLTLLWRNTPVVFIGFFLAIIAFVLELGIFRQNTFKRFLTNYLLFILFFIITMGLGSQKSGRYLLPVYPPIILIATLGWLAILEIFRLWLQKRFSLTLTNIIQAVILICLVGLQLVETIRFHPYYHTYYNPIMGNPQQASKVLRFGWGEGLDQVATYLETKPNPEEISVMSVSALGPLSFFFSGTTIRMPKNELTAEFLNNLDYVVIYIQQWQLQYQSPLLTAVDNLEPEYIVTLNGLEYARVYNVIDFTIEDWEKFLSGKNKP